MVTYPTNAKDKSRILATSTFPWQLDPGGEYSAKIVTSIEEKEAGDGGEVDVCPDIIRIVTKEESLINSTETGHDIPILARNENNDAGEY